MNTQQLGHPVIHQVSTRVWAKPRRPASTPSLVVQPRGVSRECRQGPCWGQGGESPARRLRAGLGWPGKPSQPAWSPQAGAGGPAHQHTGATQASNLDVGREGMGPWGWNRVDRLGPRSGGWEGQLIVGDSDQEAKNSLPVLQVTPRPSR